MSSASTGTKENNKNAANASSGQQRYMNNKKFLGGNINLQGKIFEINARDAVHQFAETIKAIADFRARIYTQWRY